MYTFDVETWDPNLKTHGSGAAGRRGGYLIGFALKHDEAPSQWFEVGPEVAMGEDAWKHSPALATLREVFLSGETILGHNLKYDLLWAQAYGCWSQDIHRSAMNGAPGSGAQFHDTQLRAALLHESQPTGLNDQAAKYGLTLKPEAELMAALRKTLPAAEFRKVKDFRSHLNRLPSELVGSYCCHDVDVTYQLYQAQLPEVEKRDPRIFWLEENLLPVLALMEFRGIPIDIKALAEYKNKLTQAVNFFIGRVQQITSRSVGFTASNAVRDWVSDMAKAAGVEPPRTPTGAVKADAEFLESLPKTPELVMYTTGRKLSKLASDFAAKIMLYAHQGRIYPNINQMAMESEGGGARAGTRTGRFSMSKPNVQQIPKRGLPLSRGIRVAFVGEPGMQVLSVDISQQEPRWLAHYAKVWGVEGHEVIVDLFQKRKVDLHQFAADCAGITRTQGKTFNLGTSYGAGAYAMSRQLRLSVEETKAALEKYFEGMPHLKACVRHAKKMVLARGYSETWFGRRRHFDLWEPDKFKYQTLTKCSDAERDRVKGAPLPLEEAKARYLRGKGWPIQRSGVHTQALNSYIQGSSADQIKLIMVRTYLILDLLPIFSVHDELLFSVTGPEDPNIPKIVGMVENSLDLFVPMVSDPAIGPNWRDVKKM